MGINNFLHPPNQLAMSTSLPSTLAHWTLRYTVSVRKHWASRQNTHQPPSILLSYEHMLKITYDQSQPSQWANAIINVNTDHMRNSLDKAIELSGMIISHIGYDDLGVHCVAWALNVVLATWLHGVLFTDAVACLKEAIGKEMSQLDPSLDFTRVEMRSHVFISCLSTIIETPPPLSWKAWGWRGNML